MGKHKLVVFMKTSEPGRVSSVNIDLDKSTRKHIREVYGKPKPETVLFVWDCTSHDEVPRRSPQIGVAATAYHLTEQGKVEELGQVKVCPLCWRVLDSDFDLPPAKPLVNILGKELTRKQALSKGRRTQKRNRQAARENERLEKYRGVMDVARASKEFTLYDVLDATGLEVQAARAIIKKLIERDKIQVIRLGGGRGKQTIYRRKKAP